MTKGLSKSFTVSLISIIVLIVAFVIFTPAFIDTKEAKYVVGCASNVKILLSDIERYKSYNNGRYPESLGDLYPKYVEDERLLRCFETREGSSLKPPYVYIKPATAASPDTIVLIDNNHKNAKIIGYKYGNVKITSRPLLERMGLKR
ncbi:MAG: hypothetical protein WCY23_07170 [Candidatus Omnitrophota bacterium]